MKNHSKVLSAILAGSLAFGTIGAAMADSHSGYQSTFSSVRSVTATSVTLADNTTYLLPYGFDVTKLHVGERVSVLWTQDKDSHRVASIISAS